jgi:RNA polymerase primary sigma factor
MSENDPSQLIKVKKSRTENFGGIKIFRTWKDGTGELEKIMQLPAIKSLEPDATLEEIARAIGLPESTIDSIKRALKTNDPDSLEEPVNDEDEELTRGSILSDPNEDVEAVVEHRFLSDNVQAVLGQCLTDREKRILELRFGLNGEKPHTLEEVGAEFKITREGIRQIEAKAIKKLRSSPEVISLKSYYDS